MSLDNINNMNTTVKINTRTKAASKTCKIIDFSVRLSILVILNWEAINSQRRISSLRHGRNWKGISVLYRSHKSGICQGFISATQMRHEIHSVYSLQAEMLPISFKYDQGFVHVSLIQTKIHRNNLIKQQVRDPYVSYLREMQRDINSACPIQTPPEIHRRSKNAC